MRKLIPLFCVFLLAGLLWGTADAKPTGEITINLRACVEGGDGACNFQASDVSVDGATVCLSAAGQQEQCFQTEDGEMWLDSMPHGSYWARGVAPAGYRLVGITCTTYPANPYSPCKVRGDEVHFVALKRLSATSGAVTISFLLEPTG